MTPIDGRCGHSTVTLFLMGLLVLVVAACGPGGPPEEDVSDAIRRLVAADTSAENGLGASLLSFYRQREFTPTFAGEPERIESAIRELCRADRFGLDPAKYLTPSLLERLRRTFDDEDVADSVRALRLAELDVALSRLMLEYTDHLLNGRVDPAQFTDAWKTPIHTIDPAVVLAQAVEDESLAGLSGHASQVHPEYEALLGAFARYRALADSGGWNRIPEGEPLEVGTSGTRVESLIRRLASSGDLDSTVLADSSFRFDERIAAGVRSFQRRHGLEPDGVAGAAVIEAMNVSAEERMRQIALNLERWRWMPADFGTRYLYVNVPAFELHAFEGGSEVLSMAVVVGQEYNDQATPVFSDTMEYVVFNPYWNIPASIVEEEILPEARNNPSYLSRNEYEIVTSWSDNANVLSPTPRNLDALEGGQYRLRQRPGSQNALGRIKFMFPNEFDIYLHDTPADYLFERADRAYSHGCIRVEHPVELANFVFTGTEWSESDLRSAIEGGDRRTERLQEPLPVYILYWTAFVDSSGEVNFRKDLYGIDVALAEALESRQRAGAPAPCSEFMTVLDES